jgi:hypothetical protein
MPRMWFIFAEFPWLWLVMNIGRCLNTRPLNLVLSILECIVVCDYVRHWQQHVLRIHLTRQGFCHFSSFFSQVAPRLCGDIVASL